MTQAFAISDAILADYHWLMGVAVHWTRTRQDAEDALHTAIVAMLGGADGYRHEGKFRRWAGHIVRNTAIGLHRRSHADRYIDVEPDRASAPHQIDAVDLSETCERFMQLPSARFRALAEVVLTDITYEDIAARDGMALGTAKSTVCRARQMLDEGPLGHSPRTLTFETDNIPANVAALRRMTGENSMRHLIAAAMLLSTASAFAAPPPAGSDDYDRMHPYAGWITSQHADGAPYCCSFSDGRPLDGDDVDVRRGRDGTDHWFVHITPRHFPTLPDEWIEVPDDRVVRSHSAGAPPFPMVWMDAPNNRIFCFSPGVQM